MSKPTNAAAERTIQRAIFSRKRKFRLDREKIIRYGAAMKPAPAVAAQRIIAKFGGPASLARKLSITSGETVPASTVRSWQNAGIPVKWQHPVLEAASRAAIGMGPDDFFDVEAAP